MELNREIFEKVTKAVMISEVVEEKTGLPLTIGLTQEKDILNTFLGAIRFILKKEAGKFLDISAKVIFPTEDSFASFEEKMFYDSKWDRIELIMSESTKAYRSGEKLNDVLDKYHVSYIEG